LTGIRSIVPILEPVNVPDFLRCGIGQVPSVVSRHKAPALASFDPSRIVSGIRRGKLNRVILEVQVIFNAVAELIERGVGPFPRVVVAEQSNGFIAAVKGVAVNHAANLSVAIARGFDTTRAGRQKIPESVVPND